MENFGNVQNSPFSFFSMLRIRDINLVRPHILPHEVLVMRPDHGAVLGNRSLKDAFRSFPSSFDNSLYLVTVFPFIGVFTQSVDAGQSTSDAERCIDRLPDQLRSNILLLGAGGKAHNRQGQPYIIIFPLHTQFFSSASRLPSDPFCHE